MSGFLLSLSLAWLCPGDSLVGTTSCFGIEPENSSETEATEVQADPAMGYRLLTTKAYLPPYFSDASVNEVWRAWPKQLRDRAESMGAADRRQMIFERYGFTERLDYETQQPDGSGQPLQFVVDEQGSWSMNCFACHGGTVLGKSYPGAPNNRFAFELFAKEVRDSKLLRGQVPSSFDVGAMLMPLGKTRGTTNAVMFGVGLMHYRDEELNIVRGKWPPVFTHHDMDAPAWWHFQKRPSLYIDGFAQKGHRGLMQFMMVEENSGETLKSWSEDFRHIAAYLESLSSPKYPYEIDIAKARQGGLLFQEHCSDCHGTYASTASPESLVSYPNRRISLDEIGTDSVRLRALKPEGRAKYARSWLAHYGEENTVVDPDGYVAPPLDGIWATGPYLHNGSVPTLWGVLNPAKRPTVWRHTIDCDGRLEENLNREEVGIEYTQLPEDERFRDVDVFDTRLFGKSNSGHTFPDALTPAEKRVLLEYLKTL